MIGLISATVGSLKILPPPIVQEMRGAWVATVDNIDWPVQRGESTADAQKQLTYIVDVASKLHLNALMFQVRPSADALYDSKLEPWSEYLTGKQGQPPYPLWDPLQFLIEKAHAKGIEVMAWFNPYRAFSPAQKGPNSPTHISQTHPKVVKKYGSFLWMDPGERYVQNHTRKVILDVVKRYDLDGVLFDDYFYPYPEYAGPNQSADFPDGPSWSRYEAAGGQLSRDDWRRENVNQLVRSVYEGMRKLKPWVAFGISPFGIYRPGVPAGIQAGIDQYAQLYSDPLKWLQQGWVDFMSPQLYWPISQTAQAYGALLQWWCSVNTLHRNMWPSNYTSRLMPSDGHWDVNEVLDQIKLTRSIPGATGNIHFSMKVFLDDAKGLDNDLEAGLYHDVALVPGVPWKTDAPLPKVKSIRVSKGVATFASTEPVRFYLVSVFSGDAWSPWTISDSNSFTVPTRAAKLAVCVTDLFGRKSEVLIKSVKG